MIFAYPSCVECDTFPICQTGNILIFYGWQKLFVSLCYISHSITLLNNTIYWCGVSLEKIGFSIVTWYRYPIYKANMWEYFFVRSDPFITFFCTNMLRKLCESFFPRQAQLTYFDLLSKAALFESIVALLELRWLCYSTWIPWLWTMIMVEECERSGMVWWWLFPLVHSAF